MNRKRLLLACVVALSFERFAYWLMRSGAWLWFSSASGSPETVVDLADNLRAVMLWAPLGGGVVAIALGAGRTLRLGAAGYALGLGAMALLEAPLASALLVSVGVSYGLFAPALDAEMGRLSSGGRESQWLMVFLAAGVASHVAGFAGSMLAGADALQGASAIHVFALPALVMAAVLVGLLFLSQEEPLARPRRTAHPLGYVVLLVSMLPLSLLRQMLSESLKPSSSLVGTTVQSVGLIVVSLGVMLWLWLWARDKSVAFPLLGAGIALAPLAVVFASFGGAVMTYAAAGLLGVCSELVGWVALARVCVSAPFRFASLIIAVWWLALHGVRQMILWAAPEPRPVVLVVAAVGCAVCGGALIGLSVRLRALFEREALTS